jgi:aspartate/methionine/tyrosine aminotransferase
VAAAGGTRRRPSASAVFAGSLLEAEGVAVVAGDTFGPGWERYLRVSFRTGSEERLFEAARRMNRHLAGFLT